MMWEQSKTYICPYCGSDDVVYDSSKVLTSNPPQYQCKCNNCKKDFYSGQCKNITWNSNLSNDFKHDQSILNIPRVGDPTPGESPYWIPFTPDPFKLNPPYKQNNYGWICPKCGRVMAPHMDSCKFCDGNTLAVTPNTLNDYLSKSISDSNSITAVPNPSIKLKGDSDLLNYITTTQQTENINAVSSNVDGKINSNIGINKINKEEMKQKFLDESDSIFEAVDKYKEWEKSLGGNK